MSKRLVEETLCEHGKAGPHPRYLFASPGDTCHDGSRRVLEPGEFVLVERAEDGSWPLPITLGLYDYQGGPVDVDSMFDHIADAQAKSSCRCGGKGFGSYVVEGWAGVDTAYVDCPDCADALAEGEQP